MERLDWNVALEDSEYGEALHTRSPLGFVVDVEELIAIISRYSR